MALDNIISVTEADFEYEVIAYSQNKPVVVDFWAEWCKPCKLLTPTLEKIANEANGIFRLAKVDVDANPNLVLRFSIRTIPTVIAFSQGAKVADFAGLIPESRIRDFIEKITPPNPANLLVQKGNSLFFEGNIDGAIDAYNQALDISKGLPAALLGLLKSFLLKGNFAEARAVFDAFPASREYNDAERMLPLIKTMEDSAAGKLVIETDLDASFSTSIRLVTRGNIYAAIDGLLDLLRQDKKYRKDRAKVILIGLLELLDPEAEDTRRYRAELASILF